MSAGGISRLRSLRASFSHVAPLVSKLAVSKVSRCSPADGVLPLWQAMQNLSSVARWVAAAEEGFGAGEFCAGEFCADSVTAEQKTAPASNIILSGFSLRSRIMIAPSHPRIGCLAAQDTPNLYLLTTQFSPRMPPAPDSCAWARSICIALIALIFASPAIAEPGKLR